ncbi:MAG: ferrous iron transport protein A [Candidatus Obscuribacterales bacterium]|nr:ferrous iron transport protein A [Steroidobacteraceae bacterium]
MISLDTLPNGQLAFVHTVHSDNPAMTPDLLRRLRELGFLPGEQVRVVARGAPGGTPLAVRIGTATFALRLIEARAVWVTPDNATASAASS